MDIQETDRTIRCARRSTIGDAIRRSAARDPEKDVSCIEALEFRYDDHVLHSLPLYHSAQMHVFIMPNLLVGAANFVLTGPDPEECCGLIEGELLWRWPFRI
jgi:hypothetical protein